MENAVLGPFIAVISFVCSVGNVPLAAALWHGGISFGGTIAFIFADLIVLPLVLIYRKFYGTKVALRLFGMFWLVMSVAGLATEYLFAAAGLVPASRPVTVVPTGVHWEYTTILNIIALVMFAGIYWLHRRRDRFGGGAGYATDVVCGMQVEKATAPARADHDGTKCFFCSDRCQERFATDRARFATGTQIDPVRSDPGDEAGTTDPVCGMAVDPQRAAGAADHAGRDYHFCSTGCRDAFRADPPRYTRVDTDAG